MATYLHAKAPADDCHQQLHPFPHLVRTWGGLQRGSLLQFCTTLFSVFLLPQEKRTKSDSNSRFPLSILFIFRLAAALPHLQHAAMTSMAWNRCISSYRIIPVSSFVLNFHALTRTKLKFMAEVTILHLVEGQLMNNKNYYGLWAGSQSSTIVLFQDGRMRSNLNDWTQRSNHSIRKVHAQNYDIFSEPLLDYLNLSCCRQISASLYGAISEYPIPAQL